MENKPMKRVLHAKDSQAKRAFFHNEIINRLDNGIKVTVVNIPEFELIKDSRITSRSIDEITSLEHGQTVFIFDVYPNSTLINALGKLECKEVNVTVLDYSASYSRMFTKNGFETLYIDDNYQNENPVFGSIEELKVAILRSIK